jgi:hypothetical protein
MESIAPSTRSTNMSSMQNHLTYQKMLECSGVFTRNPHIGCLGLNEHGRKLRFCYPVSTGYESIDLKTYHSTGKKIGRSGRGKHRTA